MKELKTDKAPKPRGSYSQGIMSENFIFLSGQSPVNPETNQLEGDDIKEQVEQTLKNIKNILESAGSSLDKVVKVNVYLSDINYFNDFNNVYEKFFSHPYPSRTTIACSLGVKKVEIDVIAEK